MIRNSKLFNRCRAVFLLAYIAEFKHLAEDKHLSFFVLFGVLYRVKSRRVLCNPGNRRTFRKVELRHVLSEISLCGGTYAVTAVRQIYTI